MIFLLTLYKALRYETRAGSLFRVLFRDGEPPFPTYFSIQLRLVQAVCTLGPFLLDRPKY